MLLSSTSSRLNQPSPNPPTTDQHCRKVALDIDQARGRPHLRCRGSNARHHWPSISQRRRQSRERRSRATQPERSGGRWPIQDPFGVQASELIAAIAALTPRGLHRHRHLGTGLDGGGDGLSAAILQARKGIFRVDIRRVADGESIAEPGMRFTPTSRFARTTASRGTGDDQLFEPSDGCLLGLVDLPEDAAHGGHDRGDLLRSKRRLGGVAVAQRPEVLRRGGAVSPAGITLRDSARHRRGELAGLGTRRDTGRHGRLSQAVPELADLDPAWASSPNLGSSSSAAASVSPAANSRRRLPPVMPAGSTPSHTLSSAPNRPAPSENARGHALAGPDATNIRAHFRQAGTAKETDRPPRFATMSSRPDRTAVRNRSSGIAVSRVRIASMAFP